MDVVYLATVVVFFLSAFGLMWVCQRLGEHKSGDQL